MGLTSGLHFDFSSTSVSVMIVDFVHLTRLYYDYCCVSTVLGSIKHCSVSEIHVYVLPNSTMESHERYKVCLTIPRFTYS